MCPAFVPEEKSSRDLLGKPGQPPMMRSILHRSVKDSRGLTSMLYYEMRLPERVAPKQHCIPLRFESAEFVADSALRSGYKVTRLHKGLVIHGRDGERIRLEKRGQRLEAIVSSLEPLRMLMRDIAFAQIQDH